tara:strand:+ start:1439 stop:1957 length:519 start_codon:yes stop_codon:yes gene_type:complete
MQVFKHTLKKEKKNLIKEKKMKDNKTRPFLYGAYGSNLNILQMERRCPDAIPVGTVVVKGWQLVFRSVADIVECEGGEVALGLWQITDSCEASLDVYEGYPSLYGKTYLDVNGLEESFGTSEVLIYTMNSKMISPPTNGYLQSIKQGYEDFDLDMQNLLYAVKDSFTKSTTA